MDRGSCCRARAAQGNWRGAHRASRQWTCAWAISNKQTDATWATNARERNQGTARGPLISDKAWNRVQHVQFSNGPWSTCGSPGSLAIHRSGILGRPCVQNKSVLLCSVLDASGSRLRCCWRSKAERELETGFVLFQMDGAGSRQQRVSEAQNTCTHPAERKRLLKVVKLHRPHAMAARPAQAAILPCPGPPWLSGLVRLTIGLRNSNARSMHTGDLSPAVPEAGQSPGGDQTLIWESSSPAYPSWSSLAISQASPSVHPSTASASTASIHHPRMVRSSVLVRPSPKTLSNQQRAIHRHL